MLLLLCSVLFCPECNYNLVAVRTPYTDCACLVTKTRKLATRVNIRWSWLQGCLEVYKSMTLVKRTGTNICKALKAIGVENADKKNMRLITGI